MITFPYIVVTDGTTAYIIPANELQYEVEDNKVEVLGKFKTFEEAETFEEKQMEEMYAGGF